MKTLSRMILSSMTLLILAGNSAAVEIAKLKPAFPIYADDKGVGLREPEGLACTEKSLLVVADTGNDRLVRFLIQDNRATAGKEMKVSQLSKPIGVQMNAKGDIFALDGKQRRIVRLDPDGVFKGFLEGEGLPSPTAMIPRSFKIGRDDAIYILDVFSARVVVLAPDGKFQRQIAFPEAYGFFSDLAVDAKGSIFLIDSVKGRLYSAAPKADRFAPLTDPLNEYVKFPVSIAVDNRGTVYMVDTNGGTIGMVAPDGAFLGKLLRMGWNEGLLYYPSQICLNEKGEVFIADRGNSRVQMFTLIK